MNLNSLKISLTLIFICWFIMAVPVVAQQNQTGIITDPVPILSPSPDASSLGKFLEVPVGEYTGIPNIGLPLWQINQGDIHVGINLSYHAGGIKVDDISSWIGTGWSLNAGGQVTRITRGLPDGYNSQEATKRYVNSQMTEAEKQAFINGVYRGSSDSEPDLYMVSAGELSFSFFEDQSGDFRLMDNNPNIRIQHDLNGFDWIITDGKGVKYKFGIREYSETDSRFRKSESTEVDGGYFFDVSSWFLSEIEDAKNNKVLFDYSTNILSYLTRGMERVKVPDNYSVDCQKYSEFNYSYNNISSKRLKSIIFHNGQVNFYQGQARLDCNGDKAIDKIEVINTDNTLVKRFQFFTSYFENNSIGTTGLNYYSSMDQKRLRLDSLREESNERVNSPYKFNYYVSQGLPYRNSNAQDHWGYFNGENNNTSVSYYDNVAGVRQGANKDINASSTLELSLSSITYPTGGRTELEFENNRFMMKNNDLPSTQYLETNVSVARITGNNDNSALDFHFEKSFTIGPEDLQGASALEARFRLFREGFDPNTSVTLQIHLRKPDGSIIGLQVGVFNVYSLGPGNYTMMADLVTEFAGNPYVYFDCSLDAKKTIVVTPPGSDTPVEVIGPGLRIKKITKKSLSSPDIVEEYSYTDPATGNSSGQVGNIPNYLSTQVVNKTRGLEGGSGQVSEFYTCNYKVYSATSNRSLINSKGSIVGYSYVTKHINGLAGGKLVSKYSNFSEFNDLNTHIGFPYPPNSSQDWKRGLLLSRIISDVNGITRKKETYKYHVQDNSVINNYGVKVAPHAVMEFAGANENQVYNGLTAMRYDISTDKYALVMDTITEVFHGIQLHRNNNYQYSNIHLAIKEIQTESSNEGTKISRFYYPKDYSNQLNTSPLASSLLESNILDYPIEELQFNKVAGVEKPVSGIINEYGFDETVEGSVFSLKRVLKANVNQIGFSGNYDFAHIPSWYEEKISYKFQDFNGNPRTVVINGGVSSTYLYSYHSQYPIAEIKNADYTTVESILGGPGLINSIAAANPTDLQVKAWVDQLRNSPLLKNAQITSYTYKPLVGMTSQTDAKGMTTTYEYDAFQRLMNVKDQNGNILKHTDYHYQN